MIANRAQAESISPLQQTIEQHHLWLQTEGREGRRANLAGADLSGQDLQGTWMPEINLRGANLSGANMSKCDLQGADLSEAVLENTNFKHAKLDGANLSRTQAKHAYFDDCSAITANFSAAMLEESSAGQANMSGANFRDALLTRSRFIGANMTKASLRYSKASECLFDQARLDDTDCRDCIFDYTRFREASLNGALMRGASFDKVLFTDTDFRGVVELDPSYQSASMEWERQSVREEIENLEKVREEVTHFEGSVKEQKRQLMLKKNKLYALASSERELSEELLQSMEWFRHLAMFWFVFIALSSTILLYKALIEESIPVDNKTMVMAIGLAVIVLGAHFFTAFLSHRTARQFASYVTQREESLQQITIDGEESVVPVAEPKSDVTYL
ncbi:MAG: hypothetical protein CMM93_06450 [Rickettsiales bacterium]|nr:hypothetical protein [Rickettsiales bacterium]|tara:strand:+ start:2222 stop:3388 length:1167 start_codon:yes stop_codon:yes gene_type:complete